MSSLEHSQLGVDVVAQPDAQADARAAMTLATQPLRVGRSRRGHILRRALVIADVLAFVAAFALAMVIYPPSESGAVEPGLEWILFVAALPLWVSLFGFHGLYDRDEERADHATADEFFGVVQAVTLATWSFTLVALLMGVVAPDLGRIAIFWALAVFLVAGARSVARAICRRQPGYVQRVLVVGRGDVGQLLARKMRQHPEYGMDLLGFVDAEPKSMRLDVNGVETLGGLDELDALVRDNGVDRIIIAFSNEPDEDTMEIVRALRDEDVVIDVVPRLFDLVGPRAEMHVIEGLPLICLRPARLPRLSLAIKRAIDLVVASLLFLIALPFFVVVSVWIKLDSPGPVFFRQERLGMNRRLFTMLKFRTMERDTDEAAHREFVRSIATSDAELGSDGMYKLRRDDAVTSAGRFLRKTSLDELPQLINVLRGTMTLVGPRPCIPYELENFEPHHFERFVVPQGITGLWQVTARANSTFGEALDMDVAYVRGWSVGLDLRILLRTPRAVLRQRRSTS